MKRNAALALAGLAFGGALLAAPSATATATATATIPTCTYGYNVDYQWQGGFLAHLTINYSLPAAAAGWTAGFDFASPSQHITSGYNANITQSGSHVSATSTSATQPIPQSGSVSVYFVGSFTISNPAPINVTFDGVSCSGYTWNV